MKAISFVVLFSSSLALANPAQTIAVPLGFQALIRDPSGNKVETNTSLASVDMMVMSPYFIDSGVTKTCILRHEIFSVAINQGALRVKLGSNNFGSSQASGALRDYIWAVFSNNPSYYNNGGSGTVFNCYTDSGTAATGPYTPNLTDLRRLRVKIALPNSTTVINVEFEMSSVSHSMVASTLNGYGDFDFLKITGTRTQSRYENIYDRFSDVSGVADVTTLANGSILTWNSTTKSYSPAAAPVMGINSLNGLSGASQTLATPGTTGTAPSWSSTGTTHTLNIPLASATSVTAGLISKADYDAFNSKLGTSSAFAGDVTGAYNATSVNKIKGVSVVPVTYVNKQVLKFDGTNWVNALLSVSDISGNVSVANGGTGLATLPAGSVLIGDGTNSLKNVAPGTAGNLLYNNAGNWDSGSPSTIGLVDKSSAQTITGAKTFSADLTTSQSLIVGSGKDLAFGSSSTKIVGDANSINLQVNGAEKARFTSDGNLYIGATAGSKRVIVKSSGNTDGILVSASAATMPVATLYQETGSEGVLSLYDAGTAATVIRGRGTSIINGHLGITGTAPALGTFTCAGGTANLISGGNDSRGQFTWSGSATGCTLTFASTFTTAPYCVVTWAMTGTPPSQTLGVASTTAAMTVTFSSAVTGGSFNYICLQ